MWKLSFLIVVVLVSLPHLPSIDAGTCEDSQLKDVSSQERPLDCFDVQAKISNRSGVYQIWPRIGGVNSNESIDVYCDMETDGGGWTVIQRRGKFEKQIDFYQDWETYKNGFGNITQEFWLGNEKLFFITNQRNYSVRFDMVDNEQRYFYASYKIFSIDNEESAYILNIRNYSGNASDDMTYFHNGQKFSTKDRQNDGKKSGDPCTKTYQAAFWFNDFCGYTNLNGIYQPGVDALESIWWFTWQNTHECLYSVEIKIRPNSV